MQTKGRPLHCEKPPEDAFSSCPGGTTPAPVRLLNLYRASCGPPEAIRELPLIVLSIRLLPEKPPNLFDFDFFLLAGDQLSTVGEERSFPGQALLLIPTSLSFLLSSPADRFPRGRGCPGDPDRLCQLTYLRTVFRSNPRERWISFKLTLWCHW